MKRTIQKLVLGLAVLGAACASMDLSPNGDVNLEITGLPEECNEDFSVSLIITQEPGSDGKPRKCTDTVVVRNGKVQSVPKGNEVSNQSSTRNFDPKKDIKVELKIQTIESTCLILLKALFPGIPNLDEGSVLRSPPIPYSSPGHWTTNVQTFTS